MYRSKVRLISKQNAKYVKQKRVSQEDIIHLSCERYKQKVDCFKLRPALNVSQRYNMCEKTLIITFSTQSYSTLRFLRIFISNDYSFNMFMSLRIIITRVISYIYLTSQIKELCSEI